jgi:uncharacterized protein
MQISRFLRPIRLAAVPLLFSIAALGLVAVHTSLQRKAERARTRAAQIASGVQEGAFPDKLAGLKLKDLSAEVAKGDLPAQIEMGRRLAHGEGVKKDEAKAALYFQDAISQAGDVGARDKRGPLVATAFRYLAQFHRHGVREANITANPAYAFDLLHHAASYFGDPQAQFELAKLLIAGDGISKNTRAAAQWLLIASRKGHAPSQALLGDMLWHGNGVKRVPGDGLGLLAIARRNAAPEDRAWVSKMFEAARAEALPIEILEANAFIVQESTASHFGAANGNSIGGETKEPNLTQGSAIATPLSVPAAGEQSLIIHGTSQALSNLKAGPMIFGPDGFDRELSAEKTDEINSAGIIQMYRPSQTETREEGASPVRYAGVAK